MVLALFVCCGFFSTQELPSEELKPTVHKEEFKQDDVPVVVSEPEVDRVIDRSKALAVPNKRAVTTSEDEQASDDLKLEIQNFTMKLWQDGQKLIKARQIMYFIEDYVRTMDHMTVTYNLMPLANQYVAGR